MRNYENIIAILTELDYVDGEFYRKGKLLKKYKAGKGLYYTIGFEKGGKKFRAFVHNVVFAYHHGIDELKKWETIDHINGDKYDNRIENLQGLSQLENSQKDSGGKLTVEDAKHIKILLEAGVSNRAIAKRFGVSDVTVSKIKRGLRFKYV